MSAEGADIDSVEPLPKKIMIHVLASIHIRSGKRERFVELFKANVPNVLAEQGCVEYTPAVDLDALLPPQILDENTVTIIEKWECLKALMAHLKAPHMLAYREEVKDLVEETELKILKEA